MARQRILLYPDPILRKQCEPVEDFESDEFKALIKDLRDTATSREAQGLAAPQIGVLKRVFVSNIDGALKFFVNPELQTEGDMVPNKEGCLSFPGIVELVNRPEETTITAKDEEGKEFTLYMDDIESVAVQHENDHLDGVLYIDKVSKIKKRFIIKKLAKIKKKYKLR